MRVDCRAAVMPVREWILSRLANGGVDCFATESPHSHGKQAKAVEASVKLPRGDTGNLRRHIGEQGLGTDTSEPARLYAALSRPITALPHAAGCHMNRKRGRQSGDARARRCRSGSRRTGVDGRLRRPRSEYAGARPVLRLCRESDPRRAHVWHPGGDYTSAETEAKVLGVRRRI